MQMTGWRRSWRVLGLLGALFGVCGTLRAADSGIDGMNLQFYTPAVDPHGMLNVNGPHLLHSGELHLKFEQNYGGGGPFIIQLGGVPVRLLDRMATANVLAAIGINNGVTLAVDVPYHEYLQGVNATTLANYRSTSLGDIRLALKFRILEERAKRPGIALLLTDSIPTGNELKFTGTTGMVPGGELIVGKSFKYFRLAATLGAQLPQYKVILGNEFDDRITYGLGIEMPFHFARSPVSLVATLKGHKDLKAGGTNGAPLEGMIGVQKKFRNGLTVAIAGGGAFDRSIGNPKYRAVLSVGYTAQLGSDTPHVAEVSLPAVASVAPPIVVAPPPLSSHVPPAAPETCPVPPPPTLMPPVGNLAAVTVNFSDARRPRMNREQRGWLKELIAAWQQHPDKPNVRIEGHADRDRSTGRARQSAAREMAYVESVLRQQGVPANRCVLANFGDTQPHSDSSALQSRYLNQRVNVVPIPSQ